MHTRTDQPKERSKFRKMAVLVFANCIGTTIEAYDFFLFGIAAGLVFDKIFFVSSDPALATVIAFGTFAAGYIMRPIGGLLFGHFGDKWGRKNSLIITLVISGVATFCIGLLPSYEAIGAAAPIMLVILRLFQGIALGGEAGGAILMAAESSPISIRGRIVSTVHFGYPLGVLAAVGAMAIAAELSGDNFLTWGWRIPFFMGGIIVLVGYVIRRQVSESPVFEATKNTREVVKWPVADVLRNDWRQVISSTVLYWCATVTFFYASWLPSYMIQDLDIPRTTTLQILGLVSFVGVFINFFAGWLSDLIGRRKAFAVGALLQAMAAYPAFTMLGMEGYYSIFWGVLLVSLGDAVMGPIAMAHIAESFRTSVRYTGVSIAYQVGAILGSGLSVLLASWIVYTYGDTSLVSAYLIGLSILGVFVMFRFGRETVNDNMLDGQTAATKDPSLSAGPITEDLSTSRA